MTTAPQIQALIDSLSSQNIDTLIDAINQLAELKAVDAVPALIDLLDHEDFNVRIAVVGALGSIGDERAIASLSNIEQKQAGPLGSLAATALFAIGTPAAMKAIDHLRDDDDEYALGSAAPDMPQEEVADEKYGAASDLPDTGALYDLDEEPEPSAAEKEETQAEPPEPKPQQPAQQEAPPPPRPAPAPAVRPAPGTSPPGEDEERKRRERISDNRTEASRDRAVVDDVLKPAQDVQFSAYYPREIRPGDWQPMQAYIFKQFAEDKIAEDAEKQIGPLGAFRRIVESATRGIPEGEMITATPQLPGFQFNPPSVTIGFYEDWHRFAFKLRAVDAPLNQAANGLLTFTASGIIVADIPLSVFVTQAVTKPLPQPSETQPIYDTVFASYSHRDTRIVEQVETAAKSFGMTYLRDVITLRSGEDWSAGLLKMIDEATIFQLFWSAEYATSQHCRAEWEYAVSLQREAKRFIRPVYWAQPMPAPPPELAHLHFAYQPNLVH